MLRYTTLLSIRLYCATVARELLLLHIFAVCDAIRGVADWTSQLSRGAYTHKWMLAFLFITGTIAQSAKRWYLSYSERPIFRFFTPQERHVALMGVKFGTEELRFHQNVK